jgi:hypothetical protein
MAVHGRSLVHVRVITVMRINWLPCDVRRWLLLLLLLLWRQWWP